MPKAKEQILIICGEGMVERYLQEEKAAKREKRPPVYGDYLVVAMSEAKEGDILVHWQSHGETVEAAWDDLCAMIKEREGV